MCGLEMCFLHITTPPETTLERGDIVDGDLGESRTKCLAQGHIGRFVDLVGSGIQTNNLSVTGLTIQTSNLSFTFLAGLQRLLVLNLFKSVRFCLVTWHTGMRIQANYKRAACRSNLISQYYLIEILINL
jgi:hypothetical protein